MTTDNDFILGKVPKYDKLFVGCGWNGTEYKFAPIIGKILSELAIDRTTEFDVSRFNPSRFQN